MMVRIDVLLVQHLVVLEVVQQRGRRELGIAGEEHRGAGHDVRRLLLQAVQQRLERHFGLAASCWTRMRVPRRQVRISITMAMPNSSGTQAPSSSFSRLAEKNVASTMTSGTISSAACHTGHCHSFQITMKPSSAVDHHGGGDRDAVGRGERARGAEQADQQQHADQQRGVDARHIDLAGHSRRGVQDGEPRQQAELDRLPHQRIGAGDHRLARDHGGGGGEHDHRQQQRFRHQPIERILDRRRIGQHQRALAEIVDQQRRQHEAEPGALDRLAAEMAEIGIERLAAGDGEKHRAERDQADVAVRRQKLIA